MHNIAFDDFSEVLENDVTVALFRNALKSALETHAMAVADVADHGKALAVAKKFDGGHADRIALCASRLAELRAVEAAWRGFVDGAVNDLADAEAAVLTRSEGC